MFVFFVCKIFTKELYILEIQLVERNPKSVFFLFIALIPARSNSLFSGIFTENSKIVPNRIDRDDFTEAPGCACFFPFQFYRSFF